MQTLRHETQGTRSLYASGSASRHRGRSGFFGVTLCRYHVHAERVSMQTLRHETQGTRSLYASGSASRHRGRSGFFGVTLCRYHVPDPRRIVSMQTLRHETQGTRSLYASGSASRHRGRSGFFGVTLCRYHVPDPRRMPHSKRARNGLLILSTSTRAQDPLGRRCGATNDPFRPLQCAPQYGNWVGTLYSDPMP